MARGHRLASETDTEVLAHLIEEEVAGGPTAGRGAARPLVARLRGSFSVAVVSADEPDGDRGRPPGCARWWSG